MKKQMPNDYLDDLVASQDAAPPGEPSGPQAPGPAGAPEERRPELVAAPDEIRAEQRQPAMAPMGGGEEAGRAAGAVPGRMMAVMPDMAEMGSSEGLVAAVQGIALMGLPASRGATKAVGSKI